MKKHKIKIYKTVTVEAEAHVDCEVEVTNAEILESVRHSEDFDEILEECGFLPLSNLGMDQITILDKMKLELIGDLLKNATINQLEEFKKSL